jgi:hypothetical protein
MFIEVVLKWPQSGPKVDPQVMSASRKRGKRGGGGQGMTNSIIHKKFVCEVVVKCPLQMKCV